MHPIELENALNTIVVKGFYYPDWATAKLLNKISFDYPAYSEPAKMQLNQRELEFLQYAVIELTYKEIGEKMFCSARTVESYRDSLFDKLKVKTRVDLVVYALKTKIIKL